jgi:hypothetical protein
MTRARFSNFLSTLLEFLPQPADPVRNRASAPVAGSRYHVHSPTRVQAVILPLGTESRRVSVPLPVAASIWIHAATRPDHAHVYGVPESPDVTELMPTEERDLARARGYLLEISRDDLHAHYTRG